MTVDAEYSRPRIHRGSFLLVRKKEINKNKRTVERRWWRRSLHIVNDK